MSLSTEQKVMLAELAKDGLHEFKWGSAKSNLAATLVQLGFATLSNGSWGYYIYRLTAQGQRVNSRVADLRPSCFCDGTGCAGCAR